jgi:glycosyltransferase involved in cell wall biosynthesis
VEYFHRNFRASIDRADHIITGSNFTADEIATVALVPKNRITVIHHGIDPAVFRPRPVIEQQAVNRRLDLPSHFAVYVGSVEPRKNLDVVIQSWPNVERSVTGARLVVVGDTGWHDHRIKNGLRGIRALCVGRLSGDELAAVLSMARAMVYPSRYEGFGIPPIEALACGCPVIASDIPPVREACAGHASLFPADDVDAWARALIEAMSTEREEKVVSARIDHASSLTWKRSAAAHLHVLSAIWYGKDPNGSQCTLTEAF